MYHIKFKADLVNLLESGHLLEYFVLFNLISALYSYKCALSTMGCSFSSSVIASLIPIHHVLYNLYADDTTIMNLAKIEK